MKKEKWELWMKDSKLLEDDFSRYLKKRFIRKGATALEVEGHLNKAKRNLRFARRVIDEFQDYFDWSIIAYYYAVYQAALSLCASRGFKTKKTPCHPPHTHKILFSSPDKRRGNQSSG